MKNLLLSVFLCLAMSFSFAQSSSKKNVKEETLVLKKNTVRAVDYMTKNLKLNSKQKAIFMNAYSEYANSVAKGNEKANSLAKGKRSTMDAQKQIREYVIRFTEKRNKMILDCLNNKQKKEFTAIQKRIHPMTLEVIPEKKK